MQKISNNKAFTKLKNLRQEKNISSKQMAETLGISKAFYCQLENRTRRLSYSMAVKIANIFKNSGKKVIILNTRSPILAESLTWADCVLIGYSWRCEYSLNAMIGVVNGEFEAEGIKPF